MSRDFNEEEGYAQKNKCLVNKCLLGTGLTPISRLFQVPPPHLAHVLPQISLVIALFLEQTLYILSGIEWQEEKGTTDDERVGWHCQLNGHEFEQALGDGEGQGSLACCNAWDHKKSDTTEWLNNSKKTLGLPFLKKNQPGDFPGFPVAKAVCSCPSTAGSQV